MNAGGLDGRYAHESFHQVEREAQQSPKDVFPRGTQLFPPYIKVSDWLKHTR